MSPQLEIQLIAVMVAVACALPGTFLVLRRMAMMSDSISHTILLGIVLAFFITRDLSSPLLILGAALIGLATVWMTETLKTTRLMAEDAAIGIVFPLLFSIAVILITGYADSVHLDTDSVLLGELAFAPFDRLVIGGQDMGARALYITGGLLAINLLAILLFFKELKLATFDPLLAATLGFAPTLVYYGLMGLVSITAVGAFQAVGSVLVVAFMVGPPLAAYLLTDRLSHMLLLSSLFAAFSGLVGYYSAMLLDVSIAGSMAVAVGAMFLLVFLVAPRKGLFCALGKRWSRRKRLGEAQLLLYMMDRDSGGARRTDLYGPKAFKRDRRFVDRRLARLKRCGCLQMVGSWVMLTDKGREEGKRRRESLLLRHTTNR
ncbi:MAG: metal ABC transporter permease [Christensenellales bacterium]|jgi:manganese/zinc/iron transport system permease protein